MIENFGRGDRVFEKTGDGISVYIFHSLNTKKYSKNINVFLYDDMRTEHSHLIKIESLITKDQAIEFINGEK